MIESYACNAVRQQFTGKPRCLQELDKTANLAG